MEELKTCCHLPTKLKLVVSYQLSSTDSDKLSCLDSLSYYYLKLQLNRTIFFVTDGTNLDLTCERKVSTKSYKTILHTINLQQHITMATGKGKLLFDYICSNIPNKLANTNLAHTPYIFVKIYKKDTGRATNIYAAKGRLTLKVTYKTSVLPLSKVFGFDDPDNQRSTLSKLVIDCIDKRARTRCVKFTRPITPWMKNSV